MAEAKTKPTKASVNDFLNTIENEQRRKDCKAVTKLMSEITDAKPEMWGPNIIGFGRYLQKYANGREAEWPVAGFSPRKSDLTLYIGSLDKHRDLMKKLGKHRTGKVCLYIKKLDDIDLGVLHKLVAKSVSTMAKNRIDKAAPKTKKKQEK
ncbi:MAG TPA: DUF1801 domain-containing protein [Pyrinomonadaceae bacterium]|nr:DUF1801 domain-containing protein [Pyrinomonadaceae bacterium]